MSKRADKRALPFALPRVGSEAEEAIALLSYVADELLEEYYHTVARIRQQAERSSNGVLVAAMIAFALFLAQDFESAPVPQLLLLALLPLLLLLIGLYLRTWMTDTSRFYPPQIIRAQKLSWQWVAVPIDQEQMIVWDTLTDEGDPLDLPPTPPKRQDWLLRESIGPLHPIEEEKELIDRLGNQLEAWREKPRSVRLPRIDDSHAEVLTVLKNLPRGRYLEPAPLLPPARRLGEGLDDLRRLLVLNQSHHLFLRQLDAWEDVLPRFQAALDRALRATLPSMAAPPAPPSAHPSADVEAVLGTLEVVRTTTVESLRETLTEALVEQEKELDQQLKALEEEWERERNHINYTNDTLINSLKRQMDEIRQRTLPEAEQALKESQAKHREAAERVMKCEADLAEKRKQLLLAGTGSKDTPRASDERKQQLSNAIDRLTTTLPEIDRTAKTLEEMVEFQRSALLRVQRQLDALEQEHQQYTKARDQELERVDNTFQTRQSALRDNFEPIIKAIEADLIFFDELAKHVSAALEPFRADLIMEDEAIRPYNQVVQQTYQLLSDKQGAVLQWAESVRELIQERREAVHQIVEAIETAALPNFGVRKLRIMLVPIWYVETQSGQGALWPWQRGEPVARAWLVAPFAHAKEGRRVALPDGSSLPLRPITALQERLDTLMDGERREAVQQAARHLGRMVPFESKRLSELAMRAQMPRAMVEMLQAFQHQLLATLETPIEPNGDCSAPDMALSDDFLFAPPEAWEDEVPDLGIDEEAWQEPGARIASSPELD
ncbi:MAG: hypothetical protein M3220_01100 [Chloroflexota bacterium]|nr:hypothetical protein [Chloroflexota bacterium]